MCWQVHRTYILVRGKHEPLPSWWNKGFTGFTPHFILKQMMHVAGYVSDQLVKGSHWTAHPEGYGNGSILIGPLPRGTGEQWWHRAQESMGDLIPQSPNLNTEWQMGAIFMLFNMIKPTISQCRHCSTEPLSEFTIKSVESVTYFSQNPSKSGRYYFYGGVWS